MGRDAPLARQALLLLLPLGLAAAPASAQSLRLVERDGSLGIGDLEVGPGIDPLDRHATYLITPEMGERSSRNLLHSFKFFGIGQGETATFTGPDPIDGPQSVSNVIGRVTGGTRSEIDGTLRSTIPGADVWLFNPQGVGIGAGAEIDVPGSFHAGSADSVEFEDGGEPFRARAEPEPLLATAKPSAFGFLPDGKRAALVVKGGLAVTRGEALLAGGDVLLSGAELSAPGGHLGFEASGQVTLTEAIVGGKVVPSLVDVGGLAPGTVSIRGGQILIEKGSRVLAENESPLTPIQPLKGRERKRRTTPGPGSISVEAGESVTVDDGLLSVSTHAAGNAGTIRITGLGPDRPPPTVTFRNGPGYTDLVNNRPEEAARGARAETAPLHEGEISSGRGGRIEIDAGALTVTNGVDVSAAAVGPGATGDAGEIAISASSLELSNRSFIGASGWLSPGDGGTVAITLRDGGGLTMDGEARDSRTPYAFLFTQSNFGNPGTIEIRGGPVEILSNGIIYNGGEGPGPGGGTISIGTKDEPVASVAIFGGGSIDANTYGKANAGTVEVHAGKVAINSGGSLSASTSGAGNAGNITLDAGSLVIESGGSVGAGTTAAGNAGTIAIEAAFIELRGGGRLAASTSGEGHGGTIQIIESGSLVIGSGGFITAGTTAAGNAGTIAIEAGFIELRGGGRLAASTSGEGHGGTIQIIESGSLVIGSGGFINAGTIGAGNAGDVTVRADSVKIEGESAFINAGNSGAASPGSVVGNAGEIDVVATDSIVLTNKGGEGHTLEERLFGTPLPLFTGIFSATVQGGEGGSIQLEAPEITVTDGAGVSTSTVSGGTGGTIDLLADRILVANGGYVDSTSLPYPGVEPGAARDSGDAGSVTLDAREWIEVSGHSDEFGVGRVSSFSLGSGAAGAVTLTAPKIAIDGGAVLTTAVPSDEPRERTRGGAIRLDAGRELLVRNGGRVDASTFIAGPGGSIDATAGQSIRVEGQGSGIASRTGGTGVGGSVVLRAPQIEVRRGGEVSAESAPGFGPPDGVLAEHFNEAGPFEGLIGTVIQESEDVTGDAGSVTLAATKLVHLDDGDITTSVGVARGGDITIDPVFVILENGSRIVATAGEGGTGGGIRITTDNFFQFPGSVVSAVSDTPELSGTVEIHSPDVNLAGTLTPLPSAFLDAASRMRERCAARRNGERSGSFAVRGPGGIPSEPDGWLRAPVVLADTTATADATTPAPLALVASLSGPLLVHGTCP